MDPLPVDEVRRLDRNAEELGVPLRRLMERAGRALADAVQKEAKAGQVLLLCGKGHNGGDGLVAARMLLEAGRDVRVVLLEPPGRLASEARHRLQALPKEVVERWRRPPAAWKRAAVAVDCLLGSGIRGRPRPPYDQAVRWLGRFAGPVVSCDVPSGLGSSLAVRPKTTVTFHAPKEGMDRTNSGRIVVADIGIPRRAATGIGVGDLELGYVRPQAEGHKGQHGRVLVVAGGPFTGAAHYAGLGAVRAGADLVHLATPAQAAAVVACWGPDLLVHASNPGMHLDAFGAETATGLLEHVDTVVLGCGLGREEVTLEAAHDVLRAAAKRGLSAVVDADGLDVLGPELLRAFDGRLVLTPHAKEFQDLAGRKATRANVVRFAAEHRVTVLRKGAEDLVTDGQRTRVCRRGHPAMTVGGTGDVLAGVTGTLLSKGAPAFQGACAASYLNKVAGETAAAMHGYGMTASDLIQALPAVLRQLE